MEDVDIVIQHHTDSVGEGLCALPRANVVRPYDRNTENDNKKHTDCSVCFLFIVFDIPYRNQ